jgi:hypothetical protein
MANRYDFWVAMNERGNVAISDESASDAIDQLEEGYGTPEAVTTVKFTMTAPTVQAVDVPDNSSTKVEIGEQTP